MDEELDSLTGQALEASINVAELFERRDPSAPAAFNEFYTLAVQALDMHAMQLDQMARARSDFDDQLSFTLTKLQNAAETRENIAERKKSSQIMSAEIESLTDGNRLLASKLVRYSSLETEIDSLSRSIARLEAKLPQIQDEITAEQSKQAKILAEIEALGSVSSESDEVLRRKIKKNQMKIVELEAVIRKTQSTSASEPPVQREEPKPKVAPSMIIHRTQDSDADEVRVLRTAMEECLQQNSAVKSELLNLRQDLAAMQEENAALKELMRSLLAAKQ
jgi:hypothetical protein